MSAWVVFKWHWYATTSNHPVGITNDWLVRYVQANKVVNFVIFKAEKDQKAVRVFSLYRLKTAFPLSHPSPLYGNDH